MQYKSKRQVHSMAQSHVLSSILYRRGSQKIFIALWRWIHSGDGDLVVVVIVVMELTVAAAVSVFMHRQREGLPIVPG